MAGIIDMRLMRYINLFEKIAKVSTTNCFVYNNVIIFAVPEKLVSRAVGPGGANARKLGATLRKRIKVIAKNDGDMEKFIADVVSPVEFNKIEIKDGQVVVSAGRQNKAALIGRGRIREKELGEILRNFFGVKGVRIA